MYFKNILRIFIGLRTESLKTIKETTKVIVIYISYSRQGNEKLYNLPKIAEILKKHFCQFWSYFKPIIDLY